VIRPPQTALLHLSRTASISLEDRLEQTPWALGGYFIALLASIKFSGHLLCETTFCCNVAEFTGTEHHRKVQLYCLAFYREDHFYASILIYSAPAVQARDKTLALP